MQSPLIEANSFFFSKLLQKGSYEVPWHQRYYDWKSDHVKELLTDIEEAVKERRQCYFLGTVILVQKETNHWEINDGQQRMITFSLICAALCRKFIDNGPVTHNEARALRILFNLDSDEPCSMVDAQNYSPRITPQLDDQVAYWNMIRGNSIGANGIITSAWREIDNFFSTLTLDESKDYFDFVIQKLEVASIVVPPEVDPNAVYETINCRGKILDDVDLIRNYIYSHFNDNTYLEKRRTVHEHLERIQTHLRAIKRSEYMRCHLQCLFGFLRKDKFYQDVRKEIKNQALHSKEDLPDFTFRLAEKVARPMSLSLFSGVIISPSPDPAIIKSFTTDSCTTNSNRNLAVFLWEMKAYTVTQPLVFALLMTYLNESDGRIKKRIARIVNNQLSNLSTFILRTAFVAPKFEPSHFEEKFSDFAAKIMQNNEISREEFADFLKDSDRGYYNILNDSTFIDELSDAQMSGKNKIKRFLFGVNQEPQRSFHTFKDSEFTVEHILPQSDQHWGNWDAFVGQDTKEWVNRIGNLTLLTVKDNRPGEKFNQSFQKKKEIFRGSSLSITSQLAEYDDWTPERIEKRQNYMIKRAAEVWRFKR